LLRAPAGQPLSEDEPAFCLLLDARALDDLM
jgi:hypothetical protein